MFRTKLFSKAVAVVFSTGLFALSFAQETFQMAVHVTGASGAANNAINTALGRPIEAAFTGTGRFSNDRGREFAAAARRAEQNAQIIAVATEQGVRFVCVIDASNVRVAMGAPPRLSGTAQIRILDAAHGREVGAPQTVNMPPENIQTVATQLVTLALSATADVIAAGPPPATGGAAGGSAPAVVTLENHRFEDEEPTTAGGTSGNTAFGSQGGSQFAQATSATQTQYSAPAPTADAQPARAPRERAPSQPRDSDARITGGGLRNEHNARVQSQGGFAIGDNASIISDYAAAIVGVGNMAQATWGGGGFGQIMAVKTLGETMTLGILANTPHPVFVVNPMGMGRGGKSDIPQILLGFDLDALRLGVELSPTWVRSFDNRETSTAPGSGVPAVDIEESDWFFSPTLRVSAGMDIGEMELLARVGIGFPMGGREVRNANNPEANVSVDYEDMIFFDIGAELMIPSFLGATELTVGGSWSFLSDSRASNSAADVTNSNSHITAYLELGYEVLENANLIVGYQLERDANKNRTEGRGTASTDSKTVNAEYVHSFAAGLEHVWDNVRFFDDVALRGGAYYAISNTRNTNEVDAPEYETRNRSKEPTDYDRVIPTLGLGASKGAFSLDLFLSLQGWNNTGAFAGPPVGAATVTVEF